MEIERNSARSVVVYSPESTFQNQANSGRPLELEKLGRLRTVLAENGDYKRKLNPKLYLTNSVRNCKGTNKASRSTTRITARCVCAVREDCCVA
jgi:hypothetical protein